MSNATATEYADSLIAGFNRRADQGAPLGLVHRDTDEWTDDTEAFEDWQNNADTEYTEASGYDYLSDALDIQYIVNSDRTYRAARICIALGGPTAWINTLTEQLEVAWWSAPEYRELPKAFVDALDEALAELWEMGA